MSNREVIHQYLKNLSTYLSRLNKEEATEVIKEIESHILDVVEAKEQAGEKVDANAILAGFGSPRELAEQYVAHMLEGTPPPVGFNAIQTVKKGITRGAYYGMFAFGVSVSTLLILVGLAKFFLPDQIGLWSSTHGNSVILAFAADTQPNAEELLGYWLAPIAVLLGLGVAKLTKSVLRVLKHHL
ncbi:HAAS signaling domain-containing protein [Thalassotalea marina]|uniref:DUF1700 domain-containing protein n=1 Tax=Thalassotalea marina TaxID=1673741 RepID=A0A919BIK4_9GAMM|nr:hypothetical protein [Thalassotalea marina]GHF94263.1 hypothetical protein GCM10017161_23130 [Thalassotalea marina]